MNKSQVFRVKSDNFDCYMSYEAYQSLRLSMSSGDFGAHKAKRLYVDGNQLERLKYHSKVGFVDMIEREDKQLWCYYDGCGDCNIEEVA